MTFRIICDVKQVNVARILTECQQRRNRIGTSSEKAKIIKRYYERHCETVEAPIAFNTFRRKYYDIQNNTYDEKKKFKKIEVLIKTPKKKTGRDTSKRAMF